MLNRLSNAGASTSCAWKKSARTALWGLTACSSCRNTTAIFTATACPDGTPPGPVMFPSLRFSRPLRPAAPGSLANAFILALHTPHSLCCKRQMHMLVVSAHLTFPHWLLPGTEAYARTPDRIDFSFLFSHLFLFLFFSSRSAMSGNVMSPVHVLWLT